MGRLALDVAEEQRVDGAGAHGEHEAGVVGDRPVGDAPGRAPDRRRDLADGEPVTGVQNSGRDAVGARHAVDLVGGLGQARGPGRRAAVRQRARRQHPASPSTWSAWKWVRTSRDEGR